MPKKTTRAPASETLLVELLTEELPPKSLRLLSEAFAEQLVAEIVRHRLKDRVPSKQEFATPRRLAVLIPEVRKEALESEHSVEGPISSNKKAVEGFARKHQVTPESLERRQTEKGEIVVARFTLPGVELDAVLATIIDRVVKKLPVSKMMRWGTGDAQFVRPVHGLVMMHGSRVIPGEVLGQKSGGQTLGHRFLSGGRITIRHARDYETALLKGKVVASYKARRDEITNKINKICGNSIVPVASDALYDEIAALVETPTVYEGTFSAEFLAVPEECLILSMQQHQRYVPLRDKATGKLLSRFLFVSNIEAKDSREIVHGNERVLRARLADAKFFYDQDRKTTLADRVSRLANVVYQNKLGSQFDRVKRIQKLAVEIAHKVGAAVEWVERAAYLSKADLLTEMVGEFPELQGIMGYYYAEHDHEDFHVAKAILEHYLPRYAGDELPGSQDSISVALADKLDTLVGIYGVGLVPTGDKDPFGLRRQALGIVRILVERKNLPSLDILELLRLSRDCFPAGVLAESVVPNLHVFMLERFKPYLREGGYAPDEIDAVLAMNPTRLDQVLPRLEAIKKFRALPEGVALSAANKRIRNILRQAGGKVDSMVNPVLLTEEAEKKLAQAVQAAAGEVTPMINAGEYTAALKRLASLRPAVDEFFDKVMVMVDDSAVRANRLALLNNLGSLFSHVADVSRLQG